ncbi:SPP1 family holin [Oceanobacillus picturae]|uniref:SPP1 family holin n=1 Tax=Oceanobacillus picturae TaxID=171693 RepID=A0A0U9HGE8_9BACI|nr:phage holin [Oceanobacillus picturae]GAQ18044.1 SPP1 family holin [Oceanobacillus picturae]
MKAAITRLIVLVVLLVNQALVTFGWNPLPFSEEEVYEGVSSVATVVVAVYTWWKNNNVTKKAQYNDEFLKNRGMK